MKAAGKDGELFIKQLGELCDRCLSSYSPCFTSFLDGRTLRLATEYIRFSKADVLCVCYGGFEIAERKQVGLFPRDIYGYDGCDEKTLYEQFEISPLKISGSGFSKFSHRDVLGAVLALGIKRETLGDIFVTDDETAAYIVLTNIAACYVSQSLESVGRDKVKISSIAMSDLPEIQKRYSAISGTVASERLDCIICLALNISREKAKQLINSGLVSVNHFEETRTDYALSEGDVISVRGSGRFILHEFGTLTRKGRSRTVIHKMI